MHILGIILYAVLVVLALSWAWSLRANPSMNNLGTAISSMLLVVFAVVIPATGLNRLHAAWMIPVGILSGTILMIGIRSPLFLLFLLLRPFAQIYLRLLRLGIPRERLIQADLESQKRMQDMIELVRRTRNDDGTQNGPGTDADVPF